MRTRGRKCIRHSGLASRTQYIPEQFICGTKGEGVRKGRGVGIEGEGGWHGPMVDSCEMRPCHGQGRTRIFSLDKAWQGRPGVHPGGRTGPSPGSERRWDYRPGCCLAMEHGVRATTGTVHARRWGESTGADKALNIGHCRGVTLISRDGSSTSAATLKGQRCL